MTNPLFLFYNEGEKMRIRRWRWRIILNPFRKNTHNHVMFIEIELTDDERKALEEQTLEDFKKFLGK